MIPTAGEYEYCDLVMKGGITSGVIYPTAVVELAKRYRFKNIGGTSAGAIAAAVTAAAELGRRRNYGAAYHTLAALPEQLTTGGHLAALFTPDGKTRRAFNLLRGFTGKRTIAGKILHTFLGIVLAAWPAFALAAVVGLFIPSVLYTLARWRSLAPFGGLIERHPLVCLLAGLATGLPLGWVVAAVYGIRTTLRSIAANGFGLCSGLASKTSPAESLTGWIHGRIQAAAGRDGNDPVTFGDLWSAPRLPNEPVTARTINFEVVTTGLTEGRPFTVPFQEGELYFDPAELSRVFPDEVMTSLLKDSAPNEAHKKEAIGPEISRRDHRPVVSPADEGTLLRRFPKNEELPIVVATRMSLSFPGLISAVPLYRVEYSLERNQPGNSEYATRVGTKVWFSDGGICSNFPLNFFDSPLPRWPTFGINLRNAAETLCATDRSIASNFVTPPKPAGAAPVTWNFTGDARWTPQGTTEERDPTKCVLKFADAIINTMQNWRDNLQAGAPGFRDRVVSVSLCPDEGGLNLAMPENLIRDLSGRGLQAARALMNDFDFGQHLFTRFRITLCAIQDYLDALRQASAGRIAQDAVGWTYIMGTATPPHYKWESHKIGLQAAQALDSLIELLASWEQSVHEKDRFCTGVPRPKTSLHATPDY